MAEKEVAIARQKEEKGDLQRQIIELQSQINTLVDKNL
jgi:hypothetical protein